MDAPAALLCIDAMHLFAISAFARHARAVPGMLLSRVRLGQACLQVERPAGSLERRTNAYTQCFRHYAQRREARTSLSRERLLLRSSANCRRPGSPGVPPGALPHIVLLTAFYAC